MGSSWPGLWLKRLQPYKPKAARQGDVVRIGFRDLGFRVEFEGILHEDLSYLYTGTVSGHEYSKPPPELMYEKRTGLLIAAAWSHT